MTADVFAHEFVHYMPDTLQERVLYVSLDFATASHLCACGCGQVVVTPLGPTDWVLIFNGDTVSLFPSIGSWNLPCQSHYWFRENRIQWAATWSKSKIEAARAAQRREKQTQFNSPRDGQVGVSLPDWRVGQILRALEDKDQK